MFQNTTILEHHRIKALTISYLPVTMKITKILGENGPMSEMCANASCPSFLFTDSGDVVVQGYELTESECRSLSKPPKEGFVKMSKDTLRRLAAQLD